MKKILLLLPLLFLYLPQKAYSQNTNSFVPNRGDLQEQKQSLEEIRQETKEEVQNMVQEKLQNTCQQIELRVRNRITNFEANKQKHENQYQNLQNKLLEISLNLRNKGFDTTELESNIAEMEILVGVYTKEYASFIDILENSQSLPCGQSQGEFIDTLKSAREQLKITREARRDVWEFYKNSIREDIKNLRQEAEIIQNENK